MPILHDSNLKRQKDAVADVVLPHRRIERDPIDKMISIEECCDADIHTHEALGI
jgi:hypothetical protein